jgi:hypothetical protein
MVISVGLYHAESAATLVFEGSASEHVGVFDYFELAREDSDGVAYK